MNSVKEARNMVERLKGQKYQLEKDLNEILVDLDEEKESLSKHEKALEIVRNVALRTQEQLQYHISDITTMALEAVFGSDAYELVVEFNQRRNKTECDLLFERLNARIDPISASGGGAVDVAAFALRVASWAMQRPKTRNTLILDEPFRYLSVNLLPKASEMLKELSSELGLQIIMVTHSEELLDGADKVYTTTKKKKATRIIEKG